jgi:GH24 family phage-related lysozyme (muramidase)
VPLEAAQRVFWSVTLPEFGALTRKTYPGAEKLPPDAQAALVSLVYNRGSSLSGARRAEMANIRRHVARGDLEAIAKELEAMKRLWVGKGLDGLLTRRDREARLVRGSNRAYEPAELIFV